MKKSQPRNKQHHTPKPAYTKRTCGNCGRDHERRACPAYGKRCNKCSKLRHFAKLCRSDQKPSKHVHEVKYESDYSDHGIDQITIDTVNSSSKEHVTIGINNKQLKFKLDSRAGTNVITKEDFNYVVPKRQRQTKLRSSSLKLTAFGGHDIPVIGKCTLKCLVNGTSQILKFQVVEKGNSLLGCEDCKKLKLITFNVNDIRKDPKDSVIVQRKIFARNMLIVLKVWDQSQNPITSRSTKMLSLSSTHQEKFLWL